MIDTGFILTVALPVAGMAALGYYLPRLLTPSRVRRQRHAVYATFCAAVTLWLGAAVMMAGLYGSGGAPVATAGAIAPVATGVYFLKRAASSVIVWGPMLALGWFSVAQRIERAKAQDGISMDQSDPNAR
ncbi:hypothetical protein [Celeribacter sp.]|uniref:hypothetical protein n=1 Tax=Celeribacter sp. TaxID=1890673 RepID=UPI003A8D3F74